MSVVDKLREAGIPQEDIRALYPMATVTRLIVSGTLSHWRHFITQRAAPHAQAEIREHAREIERLLHNTFAEVF